MPTTVALPPDLGISAEEFAAAWNAAAPINGVTAHAVEEGSATKFASPDLVVMVVKLVYDLGVAVAGGAIIELINAKWPEKAERRKISAVVIENPDGSTLLAVTAEEE